MVMAGLVWLGRTVRRRRVAGVVVDIANQVFHPTAHDARVVIEKRQEQTAPTPSPGDPPTPPGA